MSEGVDTKLNGFNLENEVLKLIEDNVWMLRELKKLQDEVIKLHLAVRPTLDHNRKMSKPRTE